MEYTCPKNARLALPSFIRSEGVVFDLKWIVQLPGQAQAGKPSKASVSWSVIASKPKDVQTTPIPD